MPSPKTQPARGMRDFLPADVRKREYVIGVIKEVYERYGFEPLETPAVENKDTLLGKYGDEGNKLIFQISQRNLPMDVEPDSGPPTDLALRYDLTVPLARVVALYQDSKLPKFFKRYQIQPVWRAERHQKGRFREFYQCDVDVVGSNALIVEAELIAAASDALERLGFFDFTIRLNHRRLIDAMMAASMIGEEKRASVLVVVDKLDKIGIDGVKKELVDLGLAETTIEPLIYRMTKETFISPSSLHIHEFSDDPYEANKQHLGFIVTSFKDFPHHDEGKILANEAVSDLMHILEFAENTSAGRHLRIDPSLARGLSYYTGTIMEIKVSDLAGSLGGGGRYDNLIGMFSKRAIPACGFSLGMERIIVVMDERGMFPSNLITSSADVLIGILDEESARVSLGLAGELRRIAHARVDVYPECERNVGKISAYAKKHGIRLMIIIGSNERETNQITVQDLDLFQRETWPIQNIVGVIRDKLSQNPGR